MIIKKRRPVAFSSKTMISSWKINNSIERKLVAEVSNVYRQRVIETDHKPNPWKPLNEAPPRLQIHQVTLRYDMSLEKRSFQTVLTEHLQVKLNKTMQDISGLPWKVVWSDLLVTDFYSRYFEVELHCQTMYSHLSHQQLEENIWEVQYSNRHLYKISAKISIRW